MPALPSSLVERCRSIELLVMDVDGVLTDGRIIYSDAGLEVKAFHVRDGSGLKIWHEVGKQSAIITGRTSAIVERRAAELGVGRVVQGAADKLMAYRQLLARTSYRMEQVCYVGDDLPDVPVFRHCGLAVAVADACTEAKSDAHHITRAAGGSGAIRETIEMILRCRGHWRQVVERLRNESLDPL